MGKTLCRVMQGQARGYGHITQQYLIFGRTTGGQHFQLNISKDIWKIVLLLSYYKNLGYWWPFAVGFMSLCLLVSKLEHFKKSCQKNIFISWDLLAFSEKRQKPPNFEQVPLPNHWTYNVLWGIFGKTISRSFIWYPRKWCMSNGLAVNKSWK